MDGISWTDLDEDEQLALAMLIEGVSTDLCDPIALPSETWAGRGRQPPLAECAAEIREKAQ
jgi:hypothetical protein